MRAFLGALLLAILAAPVPADEPARPAAKAGIDVLAEEGFARLKGRKVGLVTNHTGRAADGTPTIDLLAKADGVKLVALFSPEHGIRGELDEKVGDTDEPRPACRSTASTASGGSRRPRR